MNSTFIVFTVAQIPNPFLQKWQHKDDKYCNVENEKNQREANIQIMCQLLPVAVFQWNIYRLFTEDK